MVKIRAKKHTKFQLPAPQMQTEDSKDGSTRSDLRSLSFTLAVVNGRWKSRKMRKIYWDISLIQSPDLQ